MKDSSLHSGQPPSLRAPKLETIPNITVRLPPPYWVALSLPLQGAKADGYFQTGCCVLLCSQTCKRN